jgi:hypothetical protein
MKQDPAFNVSGGHLPSAALQAPIEWQESEATQVVVETGLAHIPWALQVSPAVQALPSLQDAPALTL